jgi:hypothetical protein
MATEPKLPACAHRVIAAMVHGIDRDWTATLPSGAEGETYPAGKPLPLREAAIATGMRANGARKWAQTPQWTEALKAAQDARAFAGDPKNIEKLILIRDSDDHDGSLRLKAIESIRAAQHHKRRIQSYPKAGVGDRRVARGRHWRTAFADAARPPR